MAKFWPNFGQKLKTIIFPKKLFSPFFKRPKNRFLCQKSGKFIVAFGRNGPKTAFLAKNSQILDKNSQKIENENFRPEFFFRHFLKDQTNSSKRIVPMAKIRKNYSSVWEKLVKKSIFGQKQPNFGQKWPKSQKQ